MSKDTSYQKLQQRIMNGFPETKQAVLLDLQGFWELRERLALTPGVILMDSRLVPPYNYRNHVVKLLHSAHQGVSSMKRRANTSVYWPCMTVDLKNIRQNCKYCHQVAPRHTKEPMVLTQDTGFPFQHVSADFF